MEFGLSRFLEMFEERFGRTVTTTILGLLGAAVALYCLKVIIEAIVYFYNLISAANFIAAIRQESISAHVIIFTAQILLTSLVMKWIWRYLFLRYLGTTEAKLKQMLTTIRTQTSRFEQQVEELAGKEDEIKKRLDIVQSQIDEMKARRS
ncbi:MAG TPA: hypothetical protein VFA57_04455 [Pseudolabrys sp.]|nr:hypothetical protein [Pseudolabrys sp.]